MKPLNRAERNQTFLRFLLLFFVTVALIITVIFFSVKVPFEESEQLRQKVFAMQTEKEIADSFKIVMRDAMSELDKFDLKGESTSATNQRVQFTIKRMNNLLKSIPDGENSIYALIVRNIGDLNEAKTKLNTFSAE